MSTATLRDIRLAIEARLHEQAPTVNILRDPLEKAPVDPDGRVHPYCLIWLGSPAGDPLQAQLCGDEDLDVLDLQVQCVGGDRDRVEHAVTRTRAALNGWRPLPTMSALRSRPTGQTIQADTTFTPPRFYQPTLYTAQLG